MCTSTISGIFSFSYQVVFLPIIMSFPFQSFSHFVIFPDAPYEKAVKPSSTRIGFLFPTILLTKSQTAICFYQLVRFLLYLFQPSLPDPPYHIFFSKPSFFYIKTLFFGKNKNLLFIQKISFKKNLLNM